MQNDWNWVTLTTKMKSEYTYISKLADCSRERPQGLFSLATTPNGRWSCFLSITPLTLDPDNIMLLSNEVLSTTFWVFGMTRPEFEPWFLGPLTNTLTMVSLYIIMIIILHLRIIRQREVYTIEFLRIGSVSKTV